MSVVEKNKEISWPFLVLLICFPTVGTFLYFVAASPDDPLFKITYSLTKFIQFLLPVGWLICNRKRAFSSIEIRTKGILGGLLFGLLTIGLILGLYFGRLRGGPVFEGVAAEIGAKVRGFGVHSFAAFALLAGGISIVHSFLEEYYWRWFVYSGLRQKLPQNPAILISSLAFAAHHVVVLGVYFPGRWWEAVVPFALGTAVGGGVWAWWYERTGSLAGPWVAHVLADVALMAVAYDLLYR